MPEQMGDRRRRRRRTDTLSNESRAGGRHAGRSRIGIGEHVAEFELGDVGNLRENGVGSRRVDSRSDAARRRATHARAVERTAARTPSRQLSRAGRSGADDDFIHLHAIDRSLRDVLLFRPKEWSATSLSGDADAWVHQFAPLSAARGAVSESYWKHPNRTEMKV